MTEACPLVSVCVITYQHGPFIEAALRSALAQDYQPMEVVVADDGSTDGTFERACAVARERPDIVRVLERRTNTGVPGIVVNCNRALQACRGKYVVLLQGDDLFLPGKLRAQVEWLETDPRRVICGHDVEVFDSDTGVTSYRWAERFPLRTGGAPDVLRLGVPYCTVSIMVRAGAFPEGLFDDRLRIVLDWKFWTDCLAQGGTFGFVEGVLGRYRRHPGNVTAGHFDARTADQFTTLALVEAEHPAYAANCAAGRAQLHYAHGRHLLGVRRPAEARTRFRAAIANRPLSACRPAALWMASFLPGGVVSRLFAPPEPA